MLSKTAKVFSFLILLAVECSVVFGQSKLTTRFSWNVLDWEFANPQNKANARQSGDYIPENGLPVGIERWNNKLFVSVPRWKDGKLDQKLTPRAYTRISGWKAFRDSWRLAAK